MTAHHLSQEISNPGEEPVAEDAAANADNTNTESAPTEEAAVTAAVAAAPPSPNDHNNHDSLVDDGEMQETLAAAVAVVEEQAGGDPPPLSVAETTNTTAASLAEDVINETATLTATVSATPTATVSATSIDRQEEVSLAPTDRDVILGEGSAGHKTNLLLQDMIRLHRILWKLHDLPAPSTREEVLDMANHIIELIQQGKSFELAGLKDVPRQFMKSTGRFFGPQPNGPEKEWSVLSDDKLKETMCDIILEDFQVDDLGPLTDMPYKDLKDWISNTTTTTTNSNPVMPEGRDAILLPCLLNEKMYEHQAGNKTIFSLASQLVTSYTNTPEKRVEAALYIMKGLDEAETMAAGEKGATTTSKTRYLIRTQRDDQSISWDVMDAASAAEFTLIFTFEVFLEKEIHILPTAHMLAGSTNTDTDMTTTTETSQLIDAYKAQQEAEVAADSIGPINAPTDYDVLFGRGGMTNSHQGNRRFRDIIALHRPDYIRAVKLDKPSVARKIVRSIRYGTPPGRFLRKHDDGFWYDVGDRTAAEKTSQGLRERSNAEKRQRSALREALRIRKEDMVEDDDDDDNDDTSAGHKKARSGDAGADLAAWAAPTLNYVGTNLPVPLSLGMKEPVIVSRKKAAVAATPKISATGKPLPEEFNTEGLPPNAVDEEGNVLVTGAFFSGLRCVTLFRTINNSHSLSCSQIQINILQTMISCAVVEG